MARSGLVLLTGGERAYVTRRFDRVDAEKIQVEDFCQLLGKPTAKKYTGSSEALGKVIDRYSSQPGDDKLTLFQMILFSFWIGNADMHLKNFSLWRDPESKLIRMSPGYDFLSTRLLISKKDDSEDLALALNGKKTKLHWSDFEEFAATLKVPNKVALRVRDRIFDRQGQSEKLVDQSYLSDAHKKKLKDIMRKNRNRLESKLQAPSY